MSSRSDATQSEEDEDPCPQGPEPGSREEVEGRHDDGADAQSDDDGEINDLKFPVAVEAVIQPGNERTNCQESDAAVVESKSSNIVIIIYMSVIKTWFGLRIYLGYGCTFHHELNVMFLYLIRIFTV